MHVIVPDLILQAVLESLTTFPKRRITKAMIIPGYGNNSTSRRSGIQSCLVAVLMAIANIPILRIDGKKFCIFENLNYHKHKVIL